MRQGNAQGARRAPYLMAPLELLRPQLQLYIFALGKKKIKEKDSSRFTIQSRRQALKPLERADLECSGLQRGEFVAIVLINLPPSPIS